MDQYELFSKPLDYTFTEEEIQFLIKTKTIQQTVAKYFIWKQERKNKKYIGFMIDTNPHRVRRTGFDNSIDVIFQRPFCAIEQRELAENWGCNNRIATGWNYEYIEQLIYSDSLYNIETPEVFIKHCKKLGFSNPNWVPPKE